MESSSTSGGSPTKVHEHSPSQPSHIPQETISSTRQQCFTSREGPVSSSIANGTITSTTGWCSTAIRTGWCSTAGDIISHTVQCILILANDRRVFIDDTVVREHCTIQGEASTCWEKCDNMRYALPCPPLPLSLTCPCLPKPIALLVSYVKNSYQLLCRTPAPQCMHDWEGSSELCDPKILTMYSIKHTPHGRWNGSGRSGGRRTNVFAQN